MLKLIPLQYIHAWSRASSGFRAIRFPSRGKVPKLW
jgi:hypothetical protein